MAGVGDGFAAAERAFCADFTALGCPKFPVSMRLPGFVKHARPVALVSTRVIRVL